MFFTFPTFHTFQTFSLHRISLLSVGKIKTSWIKDGCEVFTERLSHSCDFSERVLSSGEEKDEHERISQALEKTSGTIVLLDELGDEMTSREFAQWIGKKRDTGDTLTFVLGGAYGVDQRIRQSAKKIIALSKMTLPHELCKLMFLEQLYRAHTILEGRGYHH